MKRKILEMLNLLKETPGVYIGEKNLSRLVDFMGGYVICLYQIYGEIDPLFVKFQKFVEDYYHLDYSEKYWSNIILSFCNNEEEAFDEFFKLVELYLKSIDKLQ